MHHRFPLAVYRVSLSALFAVLLALAVLRPVPALAAGVVGSGTPESCTEAALDTALGCGSPIGSPPLLSICRGGVAEHKCFGRNPQRADKG